MIPSGNYGIEGLIFFTCIRVKGPNHSAFQNYPFLRLRIEQPHFFPDMKLCCVLLTSHFKGMA